MTRKHVIHTLVSLKARTIEEGDCWNWTGYVGNKVPQVSHDGKMISVRRLFRDLLGKPVRKGWFVLPTCGNIECVNPDHSKLLSPKQFTQHMGKKAGGSLSRKVKIQAYKQRTVGKLTWEQADEIRLSTEPSRQTAAKYGVDKSLICRIRAGKSWIRYNSPFAGLMR